MEWILPAYVDSGAGTTRRVVVSARQDGNRFLGSIKGSQIRAQNSAKNEGPINCKISLKLILVSYLPATNAQSHLLLLVLSFPLLARKIYKTVVSVKGINNNKNNKNLNFPFLTKQKGLRIQ